MKLEFEPRVMQRAWLGDAVLHVLAREWVIANKGEVNGLVVSRLISNRFLGAFGTPTLVEAELGRVYQENGLEGARAWFTDKLVPIFERQEANRAKAGIKDKPPRRKGKSKTKSARR